MKQPEPSVEELKRMLRDCVDSLEYVNSSHPGMSGYGVRYERIARAKKLLGDDT